MSGEYFTCATCGKPGFLSEDCTHNITADDQIYHDYCDPPEDKK